MRKAVSKRLTEVLEDGKIIEKQKSLLQKWAKHTATYKEEGAILAMAYTIREFGLFINKPYEDATYNDLESYAQFKLEANKSLTDRRVLTVNPHSITAYKRQINLFYQWMLKHTPLKVAEDLAYYQPKIVKKDRKTSEELHKARVIALLQNKIILTNRKDDKKLMQEELNAKYSHLVLDNKNLKVLNDFYNYKITSGKVESNIGFVSKLYLLKRLGLFLKKKNKTYKEATREDIQEFLAEVQQSVSSKKGDNINCAKNLTTYKANLLDFYRFVYGIFTEEQPRIYPEVVSWLYQKRKKGNDRLAKEIIPNTEIKLMIEKCAETRDKALIALMLDCSARVGEIVNANICDLRTSSVQKEGAQYSHLIATITLRGKTGERTNQLFYSVPHLRLWLLNHPLKNDPNAPLFIATKESRYGQRIGPVGINKILQRAASKAGIKRHIHAHLFRHTNLTRMARLLSETELKIHAGWGMSSNMAKVYVHLNEKDVANKILGAYGITQKEVEKEEGIFELRVCPNTLCSYQNPHEASFCLKCGYPLSLKAAVNLKKIKEKEEELHSELLSKDMAGLPQAAGFKEALYGALKSDPVLIDKLKEIIELTAEATQ